MAKSVWLMRISNSRYNKGCRCHTRIYTHVKGYIRTIKNHIQSFNYEREQTIGTKQFVQALVCNYVFIYSDMNITCLILLMLLSALQPVTVILTLRNMFSEVRCKNCCKSGKEISG